jgi:hypothetical protein
MGGLHARLFVLMKGAIRLGDPSMHEFMGRLFGVNFYLVMGLFTFIAGCSQLTGLTRPEPLPASKVPSRPFQVQVVGVQWLNPLVRRDYPTEWQLLWTLGLVKPNQNDEKVVEKPVKFTSAQPIAAVAVNLGGNTMADFLATYVIETFKPIGRGYIMNGSYFYTIQPDKPRNWRELHGIHVEFAMPNTSDISAEQGTKIVQERLGREFVFGSVPKLSTADIPADVRTSVGGASVGFKSLASAMDYLEKHPDKTVWVYSWDCPDFPKDEQLSENSTLLILAGPNFKTEREPLAWISRPSMQESNDFEASDGLSRVARAWQAAIRKASEQATIAPKDIGYVIHDAGHGTEEKGARLSMLGQALATTTPELDFMKQTFNTPKLLGDMRAASAVTNIALAIAWTHQKSKPVLVAGTTEPERATVVVVTPPSKPRLMNPDKDWFRARGEGNAYLPWWGMRKDEKWENYMQGYSF